MIIIGEKNSVMAKKVREALMKRDAKPIQELAVAQANAGAHYIDVSIGPAEDDGPQLMDWAVKAVHEVVQEPICLDTTNVKAMEEGIKAHNNAWGLPIINSTSNEPERFPMLELAGKYGTKVIALTLGKGGLPADAEDRCVIASEIMARGMEFGVPMENILLDPLILQIATMQNQAIQSARAIKRGADLQQGAGITDGEFSSDGAVLAVASEDGRVRLRDPTSGRLVQEFAMPAYVADLALSPDGHLVVGIGVDGTVNVWDARRRTLRFAGRHDGEGRCAAFSHTGALLATAGQDGVRVWQVATGTPSDRLLRTTAGRA